MTTRARLENYVRKYRIKTNTVAAEDPSIEQYVLAGLEHSIDEYGKQLCPCVFLPNKEEAIKEGYWICPCVPMKTKKECH